MRIVFLGPPGAGKGTQSRHLVNYLGVPHISTGEMLRAEVRAGTPIGQQISDDMRGGRLVPDELIIELTNRRLSQSDCDSGFLLDGYPRTPDQAQALQEFLSGSNLSLDATLELRVPGEELLRRLVARAESEGRTDDTPEVIRGRLNEYSRRTEPLVDFYGQLELHYPIDGIGSPEEVFGRITNIIDRLQQHRNNGRP